MHFSNGRFSNKETGFSGALVVGGLLGAAGEKKEKTKCSYKICNPSHRCKLKVLAKLAPPIAREGAFSRVFRDLHDFRIFSRKL